MKRRSFIRISSYTAGAWLLSEVIPLNAFAMDSSDTNCFQPNPQIRVCEDGRVILYIIKQEMGQGVITSLPLILAEELDVDPEKIVIEGLPYDAANAGKYNTYASASIKGAYSSFRKAGATARTMLINAAAAEWNVNAEVLKTENSKVVNTLNGQSINYNQLIKRASALPVPENPVLKNPKDFKLIGKSQRRSNIAGIVTGKALYGFDLVLPDMVYAAVVRAPLFYGKVKKWDDSALKQLGPGILQIVEVTQMAGGVDNRNGVAVVATNSWLALRGQQLLKVEWDLGTKGLFDSTEISQQLKQALKTDTAALTYDKKGKSTAFTPLEGANVFRTIYEMPYQAHAAMEPMNCTASYKDGKYEIWGGFQAPGEIAKILPKAFGVATDAVFVNLLPIGGAFGRKEKVDNAAEAMQISKAIGKPVKMIFSRADDTGNDFYRPASYHQISVTADKTGITDWAHQLAVTAFPGKNISHVHHGIGGAVADLIYPVKNYQSAFYPIESPIPIGSWRAIGFSHNVFVAECLIDELAAKFKVDPVEYRLSILRQESDKYVKDRKRLENVLIKCAEAINWNHKPLAKRFRGIACCAYPHAQGYAAHAFEISVAPNNAIKIHKVVCAVDCGLIVDPEGFKSQIEGSLVWSLSATLKDEISLQKGQVQQQSFFDYDVMRLKEMPKFEIVIIPSDEAPGGAGEPAVPSVSPALCNAIFAATGKRVRKLPLKKEGYTMG
ncbi:MAG: xanthine dehydrogenase family protein molybdopterin-binding subunit [Sphingobacteriaceae bacterium]|nr:xanthine dehydrogenase family protein molybdopterin-binding subunit [Sphingobacteriaceae bacterium]